MRILLVTPYPPARDGIGDYATRLRGGLVDAGHEVRVIADRPAPDAPAEVLGAIPRGAGEHAAVLAEVERWRPDVVHVQFAVAAYGTRVPALLRLLGALDAAPAPVVMTLHEVTRDVASLRAAGRLLYRRLAARADRLVVHTPSALDALRRVDPAAAARAAVVPHLRPELPAPTTSPDALRAELGLGLGDAPVLLAFGFIHVDKGLDDLVEAFAATRARRDGARLVVAGDVRPRNGAFRLFELRDRLHLRKVRRIAGRTGLGDQVRFTGYVPSGHVRPMFELAAAAVLPYRRIEESGVASLAAAAGTPVLVSDVGDLAHHAGDPRRTFPPGRPDAIARALDDFTGGDGASPAPARAARPAGSAALTSVVAATLEIYAPDQAAQAEEVLHVPAHA